MTNEEIADEYHAAKQSFQEAKDAQEVPSGAQENFERAVTFIKAQERLLHAARAFETAVEKAAKS